MCIVGDRGALEEAVVDSLRDQGHLHPYFGQVEYRQEAVGSTSIDFTELVGRIDERFAREFVERNHKELFFLKSSDWATEYEFRCVVTGPDTRYVHVEVGEAITGVVVGERVARWQRASVLEQCRELGVGLLQVEWSTGKPRLWPIQKP